MHSKTMHSQAEGVTWFLRQAANRALFVASVLVALVAVSIAPASAKPGNGGNGGNGDSGGSDPAAFVCGALSNNVTFADINAAIGADDAHAAGLTGAGIDVAIIDTGVSPVPGLDGAGQIVNGPDLSFGALDDNLRHLDLNGHGTNMAAIISADHSALGDGVAPGSRIVNIKAGAGDGTVDISQIIAAVDWVVENRNSNGMNIRVLSLAVDTDHVVDGDGYTPPNYFDDPLSFAVESAWHHGIVVVAAGGNDGRGMHRLGNPAINPYVIAVGASQPITEKDYEGWKVSSLTSRGDGIRNPDLVAPGAAVLSSGVSGSYLVDTYPEATCQYRGETFLRGSGTSQAGAVVAGAAALLLEQRPELSPDQVKALLTGTATELIAYDNKKSKPYHRDVQGHGMLDVAAAVGAATPSGYDSSQVFAPALGHGSLEDARGPFHVGTDGDYLTGEVTAFGGEWDSIAHASRIYLDDNWTGQTWSGFTWAGGTWMGSTWSGATWSGATWSGAAWSGATWSGATWSGATWSGATWSGATWSGATWSGATWSGATWSGANWE